MKTKAILVLVAFLTISFNCIGQGLQYKPGLGIFCSTSFSTHMQVELNRNSENESFHIFNSVYIPTEGLSKADTKAQNCSESYLLSGKMSETTISGYVPDDQELYKTIMVVDSIFWESYNSCNMSIQAKLYSDNIEFYHDQSGLIDSKQQILDATESSVCGQIRREPVRGSIEVYPINGYGAVEIGLHTFRRTADGEPLSSRPGKFIIIWRQLGNEWSISRVISIH